MSSISPIGGYSAYSAYSPISGGNFSVKRPEENASEMAVQEKSTTQINGSEEGKENQAFAKIEPEKEKGNKSENAVQTNPAEYAMTYNSKAALDLKVYQAGREEQLQKQQQENQEQQAVSLLA